MYDYYCALFCWIILLLAGACVAGIAMGIEGHIWYTFLDRIMAQATWRNVFKKVVLDQTIAVPIYTITYIVGKRNIRHISLFDMYYFLSRYISCGRTNICL
jgi:hypothetical protein